MILTNKKKILFLIPWLPFPLVSGGHQAIFNGILSVKDDFDIYIAYPHPLKTLHPEDKEGFLKIIPNAHLLPLNVGGKGRAAHYLLSLINYLDRCFRRMFVSNDRTKGCKKKVISDICSNWINIYLPPSRIWSEYIAQIHNQYKFDIIQVEMPKMISQVLCLPQNCKKIHVHHELGFVRRQLEIKNFESLDSYVDTCMRFADLNEINQLNVYDMVVTLSANDSIKLKEAGVNVPVRDSFAKVETNEEYIYTPRRGRELSFVGGDSHSPNYSAVIWFLEKCWSFLKESNPDYNLNIIGKWSDEHILEIREKYKSVNFLGFVDDLKSELRGTIMIVPIQVGSGIRMKILEACSMAVPFVSTTIGAEGIPVKNAEHCFLADEPSDFVVKLKKLEDPNLQKTFTKNAYNMVKNHYSLESLRSNRLGIYDELLSFRKIEKGHFS